MNSTTNITVPASLLGPGLVRAITAVVDGPVFSNDLNAVDELVTITVPSYFWGTFLEWMAILISTSAEAPVLQTDYNALYLIDNQPPQAPPQANLSLGGQIRGDKYLSLQMRNPNRPPEEQWVIFVFDKDWNISFHRFAANYVPDDSN